MSRLAKHPIHIPDGVTISKNGNTVTVKGPKGELVREFRDEITITIDESTVLFEKTKDTVFTRALWGTTASHITNMFTGVTEGYTKKLLVEGVGFKVNLVGTTLEMSLGFSHQVKIDVPENISATVEKNAITLSSIDKDALGTFAAHVRTHKKPEPYKGKGIRYDGEVILRKQGKKSA